MMVQRRRCLISEDLDVHIISFLTAEDRARSCYFVSTYWRLICYQSNEKEISSWMSQWITKRQHRCKQRRKNKTLLESQDEAQNWQGPSWKLTYALRNGLRNYSTNSNERNISTIVELLDQGALASHSPHEEYDSMGPYVHEEVPRHMFQTQDHDIINNEFRILTEFVASPCNSWCHRSYVEWPSLLLRYILFGQKGYWGHPRHVHNYDYSTFQSRWEAWKDFRLMVHSAQSYESKLNDGNVVLDLNHFFGQCIHLKGGYFWRRLRNLSEVFCDESQYWMDLYFFTLIYDFLLPLAPPKTLFLVTGKMFEAFPAVFFQHKKLLMLITPSEMHEYLRYCWANQKRQKKLYRYFVDCRNLRLVTIESNLEPFCKRKDRRILELFMRLEPNSMLNKIPYILTHLKLARGKTERLIAYFLVLEKVGQQRSKVLKEITSYHLKVRNSRGNETRRPIRLEHQA